jgi:hypothetical protein
MRRFVLIVGLMLGLVACSAPPGQGGAGASASPPASMGTPAAPTTQSSGRGDY